MTLNAESLTRFAYQLLTAAKVAHPKADLVAKSLVAANLRAVDSHGLQLLPYYLDQIRVGNISIETDGHIVSESGACLAYDGETGIGQWISDICCGHAIRLAREHGIAIVTARQSNHFGAAAFWAQRISAAGHLGIVMCNASPLVAPWQGKEPRFGTNPPAGSRLAGTPALSANRRSPPGHRSARCRRDTAAKSKQSPLSSRFE
jgi:LDH2 family malate/lactate/ureidoglycolate dehydrogenase